MQGLRPRAHVPQQKSYPTDEKLAGGTFFGIPVTGVVDTDEEYRIHVPEGSLEMEGL